MKNSVHVTITSNNAIYVNDTRITNRSTKWGNQRILEEFHCEKSEVVEECLERGYRRCVLLIDDKQYLS